MEELMRSNDPPRESELAEIREKAAAHTDRLSTLDTMISELQSALRALKTERKWVSADLTRFNQVLHPVRRLPEDVLSEIFLACISEDILHQDVSEDTDSLDVAGAPWVLLRISSRWRSVAISFPRLWSTIILNLDIHQEGANTTGTMFLLGLHLQRSASQNLGILIHSLHPEITSDHYILQVLLPSAYRWKSLVVFLVWDALTALEPIQGSLQRLENLRMYSKACEDEGVVPKMDVFRYAPRLHSVFVYDLPPTSIVVPWSQLTAYEYSGHSIVANQSPKHLESLHRAPLLERCTLDCSTANVGHPGPPLTLYKLRQLKVVVHKWSVVRAYTDILSCLTLPALEYLSVDLGDDIGFDTRSVISFLQRCHHPLSAPRLESLELDAPSLTGNQLLELLKAVPELKRLSVVNYGCFSDDVPAKLKWPLIAEQGPSMLPRLTHIALDPGPRSVDSPSFVEMIESRTGLNPHRSSLQLVEMIEMLELDSELTSRIEACCSQGLKFKNGG